MSTEPTNFLLHNHYICSSTTLPLHHYHQLVLQSRFTMNTSFKSQILKCLPIAALIAVLPLLSNSFRPTYLYFLFNLLIIVVGADAGLFSFFSKAADEKKAVPVATSKSSLVSSIVHSPEKENPDSTTNDIVGLLGCDQERPKAVAKCSEKVVGAVKVDVLKKCPSTPCLFFIGGGPENEDAEEPKAEDDYDEDQAGVPSGQELFQKAETFIRNFRMQLKMQREDSRQKIHGLYHKAF